MLKISEQQKSWLTALLSADPAPIKQALQQLPDPPLSNELRLGIILLWQLAPEEALKSDAYGLATSVFTKEELQDYQQKFELFRAIVEHLPWSNPDAAAVVQTHYDQFHSIKAIFEPLFAFAPYYAELYLDLARKLYMLFKLEDAAEACFEGFIKYNQQNDEAFYALGRIAEKRGNLEQATELYQKSIDLNTENVYAQLQLGALKANVLEDYEGAIEHYNKVIEIDPYAAEPYVRVAEACYQMQAYPRCRQFIEIALGINEFQEAALNLLGMLEWKVEGNYQKAIDTFLKGVDHQLHGDSALLLCSLGDLHTQYLQDFDKARLYYEKSLAVNPAQKNIILALAPVLLDHFNDQATVGQLYHNFLQVNPNDQDILTEYAVFLTEYLHDYELAHQSLEKALSIEPNHSEALRLWNRIGDYFEADEHEEEEEEWEDDDDDDDDFSGGGAAGDH